MYCTARTIAPVNCENNCPPKNHSCGQWQASLDARVRVWINRHTIITVQLHVQQRPIVLLQNVAASLALMSYSHWIRLGPWIQHLSVKWWISPNVWSRVSLSTKARDSRYGIYICFYILCNILCWQQLLRAKLEIVWCSGRMEKHPWWHSALLSAFSSSGRSTYTHVLIYANCDDC